MNNNIYKSYQNIPFFTIFIILCIAFYALDSWSILNNDDYIYSCFIDADGRPQEHITNIRQIIESAYNHYFTWNGRIIANCFITQSFCGIWGINIFRICNTLVFGFFLYLLMRLTNQRPPLQGLKVSITVLFIFGISPVFAPMFLGTIDYSVNYLWTSTCILFVLFLFERMKKCTTKTQPKQFIAIFTIGFFAGAMHEGFSIGLLGAICLYYLFHRDMLKTPIIVLFTGFLIGTIIMVIAPANFFRMKDTPSAAILSALFRMLFQARVIYVLLFLNAIAFFKERNRFKQFLSDNIIYYYAIILTILFVIVIAKRGDLRAIYSAEFFALIPVIKEFNLYIDRLYSTQKKATVFLSLICGLSLFGGFIYAYTLRSNLFKLHAEMIECYLKSSDGTAYVDNKLSQNVETRFTSSMIEYVVRDNWTNGMVSNYYQYLPIITLPKEIQDSANFFINSNRSQENPLLYTTPEMCFYVLNLKNIPNTTPDSKVTIREIPTQTITMKILSILHKHPYMERKTTKKYDYLIIQKNNLFTFDRLDILINNNQ